MKVYSWRFAFLALTMLLILLSVARFVRRFLGCKWMLHDLRVILSWLDLKMNDNQGLHIHVSTTFTSVSQNYIYSVNIRKIDHWHWHLCLHPYDEAWIQGSATGCLIFLKEREHISFQTYILDVSCKKYVHTVTYSLCKNTKTNNLREKILSSFTKYMHNVHY